MSIAVNGFVMYISFQVMPEVSVFNEDPDNWLETWAFIAWFIMLMLWPSTDFDFSIEELEVTWELMVPRAGEMLWDYTG